MITFTRQPDGSYVRTGGFSSVPKYASVITDGNPSSAVLRTSVWLSVLEGGPLRGKVYQLIAAAAPVTMTDDVKAKLKVAKAEKKSALETEEKSMKAEARKRKWHKG